MPAWTRYGSMTSLPVRAGLRQVSLTKVGCAKAWRKGANGGTNYKGNKNARDAMMTSPTPTLQLLRPAHVRDTFVYEWFRHASNRADNACARRDAPLYGRDNALHLSSSPRISCAKVAETGTLRAQRPVPSWELDARSITSCAARGMHRSMHTGDARDGRNETRRVVLTAGSAT